MLTAHYSRQRVVFVGALILAGLTAWGVTHIFSLLQLRDSGQVSLALIWFFSFAVLSWSNFLAFLEKPKTVNDSQQAEIDKLNVAVLVPVYNEDPALLKAYLASMFNQTRLPNQIYIVDDGSNDADYTDVINWVKAQNPANIKVSWFRTENMGKRHAQGKGIKATPDADIYLTVDSDTVLDPLALHEGLKPFADKDVQSVAGVLLPINGDQNFLTRFSGVWEVIWQLVDRSSQSVMNCVTVNSGPLALYRADTIRRYLDGYLNEKFFGRPVGFSDDSLLTTYAIVNGKTVQQPTAFCFSATPDNVNHHIRRFIRWMRGSFIRSWWRFKYLPLNSYVFWLHWFKFAQMFLSIFTFLYILSVGGFTDPALLPYLILVPILITYGQALRYLTIRRNDQSRKSLLLNYLLAPVATLWMITVLRVVKWYSYATCLKTGWGTRAKVETRMEAEA